jgi:hypothetical protein
VRSRECECWGLEFESKKYIFSIFLSPSDNSTQSMAFVLRGNTSSNPGNVSYVFTLFFNVQSFETKLIYWDMLLHSDYWAKTLLLWPTVTCPCIYTWENILCTRIIKDTRWSCPYTCIAVLIRLYRWIWCLARSREKAPTLLDLEIRASICRGQLFVWQGSWACLVYFRCFD